MKAVLSFLRSWRHLAWIAIAALLSACATTTPSSSDEGEVVLSPTFERGGRFAVTMQEFAGERQAVQGGFTWMERQGIVQIDLTNPMGTVLARVLVMPQGASLQRTDGSMEYAAGPDALVEQLLGSPIPVSYLRTWLQGQTRVAAERDEQGRPEAFVQDGWRVRLLRYDEKGPRLLQLNRNDAQRDISVRVVIDQ